MKEYLIIGQGFAGTSLGFRLHQLDRSFLTIDVRRPNTASRVASGLWNPVVLKRLKAVWKAEEMLRDLHGFYEAIERETNSRFIHPEHIWRVFHSTAETNDWDVASDRPPLDQYLLTPIQRNSNASLKAEKGLGEVRETGRIDPDIMLDAWRAYLKDQDLLIEGEFVHSDLQVEKDGFSYRGEVFRKVVFTEGLSTLHQNPWFNYLPFAPTKGELLEIHAPELKLENPIHSSHFILPLGDHRYAIGATYAWNDLDLLPTEKANEELMGFLERSITCPYQVIGRRVGIRPNTKDRKPFLGEHPSQKGLFIFNGLGSRGVLMTPYLSRCMIDLMEKDIPLPREADIVRFSSLYANQADI